MKFIEGEARNAIIKRRSFCTAFIVLVEGKNAESHTFRQYLEEENIIPPNEYIAFQVHPPSESYKHLVALYGEIPIPSLVIIGSNGLPIRILTKYDSKEELYANLKEVLDIHKAECLASKKLEHSQNEAVHILLKLPKGGTAAVEFSESSTLGEVKTFVKESLQVKCPFQMVIPFPRKVFTAEDEIKSLVDLKLNPNATILIMPLDRSKPWASHLSSSAFPVLLAKVGQVFRQITDWVSLLMPGARI